MTYTTEGKELLRGPVLALPGLAEFDFESGLKRYWTGYGPLTTTDLRTWEGIGNFASVSDLVSRDSFSADSVVFEFGRESKAGEDSIAIEAVDFAEAVRQALKESYIGRRCAVYVQTIDLTPTTMAEALIGDPVPVWAGKMSHIEVDIAPTAVAVRIGAESLFAEGLDPPHAYLTDVDQQARYPGDRFCEFVSELTQRRVDWYS